MGKALHGDIRLGPVHRQRGGCPASRGLVSDRRGVGGRKWWPPTRSAPSATTARTSTASPPRWCARGAASPYRSTGRRRA